MNPSIEERPPVSRRYRIWVEGRLGAGFTEGCEDMEQEDVDGCTILTGEIVDASQLYGVLDRLRRLGIEIVRFDTYRPRGPGVRNSEVGGGAPVTPQPAENTADQQTEHQFGEAL